MLPVMVVACCAFFAATAVGHLIEAKALGDSTKIGKARKVIRKAKKKTEKKRSKVGEPLAARNMFCSACTPAEATEGDATIVDSDSPPLTSLPLRLVATNVSTEAAYSFATILNTSTDRQGAYSVDEEIPESGSIVRITAKHVDFKNTTSKRVERISLLAKASTPRKVAKTESKSSSSKKPKDELLAMIDEGVNKLSKTEFEIDKKVVDKILENPMAVARGARIVPSIKNGKANGFKLYAIRPSSVYAKIGLMNGDTIHSINGFDLTSPDKALEVYTKVREATSLSVNATRRGKPISLNYSIK